MHVHINHSWCSDSNWGGNYDARYMVCFKTRMYTETDPDANLLVEFEYPRADGGFGTEISKRLKPKVLKWLLENVKDNRDGKGFCVGSDKYNSLSMDFTIWFQRRKDAMLFIKTWSAHKKPTTYFDYFNEIRKQLDLKTKTLKVVEDLDLDFDDYA